MILRITLLCVVVAAFGFQGREIPPHEGEDHQGQPEFCQNSNSGGYKANCKCKRDCDDPEQRQHRESGCKTFCRTPACRCDHGCPMTD
jgi:hypothetical protein